MQVRCQRLHDHNLAGERANNLCRLLLGRIVEVQPWWQASLIIREMAKNALGRPGIQVSVYVVPRPARLQTEGIAAEIYRLLIIAVLCRGFCTAPALGINVPVALVIPGKETREP